MFFCSLFSRRFFLPPSAAESKGKKFLGKLSCQSWLEERASCVDAEWAYFTPLEKELIEKIMQKNFS